MMNINTKDLEKYMCMPHSIQLKREESGFVVAIPDLPGCFSQADSLEEAYSMIISAKEAWITSALMEGEIIPEPSEEKAYSGRLLLRIPPDFHADLAKKADQQGVSLNNYLVYLLTRENERKSVEFHLHHTNNYQIEKIEVKTESIEKGRLPTY